MICKCLIFSAFALALAVLSVPDSGVTAAAVVPAANNKSHNLIVGSRLPGDRLIWGESVMKASKWLQIVTLEKNFNATKYERITQIRAMDRRTDGNGAFAKVIKGGVGYNNVTLRFKSQRGYEINFWVEVYARA